jgi:hypothetical protein
MTMTKMHLSTVVGAGAVVLFGSTAFATPPTSAPRAPAVIAAERPVAPAPAADADKPAPNSIYAEGLGAGLAYSINYERLVLDELGVRAGFGYWGMGASASVNGQTEASASASFLTIPLTVSYLGVRSGKHSLELGGGGTVIHAGGAASGFGMSASGSATTALGNAMVGYRLHPTGHAGFQFRVGAMALMGKGLGLSATDPDKMGVLPWLYLSLGGSF